MKLIKRNGAEVVFDREKIVSAILKANAAVDEDERITPGKINKIAANVENKCEKLGRAVSVEEVQDLVENGDLTPEEAKSFPGKNIITRAIGVDSRVAVDFIESNFSQGDILVLCTDGLTNYVSDEDIVSVAGSSNCFEYAEKLVDIVNENGGGDNITVVSIVS
jgi:hypothetical protein